MEKNKENPLFKEMLELSNGNNEEEFLFFVNNHPELLKEDPVTFIGLHVSYYANKEDVNKSLSVVEYYKTRPYISMEVEDFLNELKESLSKLNEPEKNDFNDEQIKKFLYSKNENAVVSALHVLSKKNIRNYLPLLKDFFLSEQPYKFKTLGIFILIEQHIEEEIKVNKNGVEYTLTPYLLDLPFDTYSYNETKDIISKSFESGEVNETATEILNTVQIKNFPDSFVDTDNTKFMADVFIAVAKTYLSIDPAISKISNKYKCEEAVIRALIEEIQNVFNS